jgi:hypothetical protein
MKGASAKAAEFSAVAGEFCCLIAGDQAPCAIRQINAERSGIEASATADVKTCHLVLGFWEQWNEESG